MYRLEEMEKIFLRYEWPVFITTFGMLFFIYIYIKRKPQVLFCLFPPDLK